MLGLGLFGLFQLAVILFLIVWVIAIHYQGSLALILLIVAFMAVVRVLLGILASPRRKACGRLAGRSLIPCSLTSCWWVRQPAI
jgi:hypothetical protein